MSCTLSLSSSKWKDCSLLSSLLSSKKISFDVTSNSTFNRGKWEVGCRVVMDEKDGKKAWKEIREASLPGVSCCHVKLPHTEGCAFDVFSERTRCPFRPGGDGD